MAVYYIVWNTLVLWTNCIIFNLNPGGKHTNHSALTC